MSVRKVGATEDVVPDERAPQIGAEFGACGRYLSVGILRNRCHSPAPMFSAKLQSFCRGVLSWDAVTKVTQRGLTPWVSFLIDIFADARACITGGLSFAPPSGIGEGGERMGRDGRTRNLSRQYKRTNYLSYKHCRHAGLTAGELEVRLNVLLEVRIETGVSLDYLYDISADMDEISFRQLMGRLSTSPT